MSLKIRIALMQFLQFVAWGSWLITMGTYTIHTKHWSASEFGLIMSTGGIAAIFMPTIAGIVADRWINSEKLYGILQIGCAICMLFIPQVDNPNKMFWLMLINMCFYMPTIPLVFSISYSVMENAGMNIIKEYPPLRIFGTLGFAAGMWMTSLSGLETSSWQFYISAFASTCVGLIVFFSMPPSPPQNTSVCQNWISFLGLDCFRLFKSWKMALFFIFSLLLGINMQLSNAYADIYLHSFSTAEYGQSLVSKYPAIIVSFGQFSEMFFVLLVPYFLSRFGIRKIMIISMIAWIGRWLLLGVGNPGDGFWLILLSMFIWGMAFDFFNLSGSLFIETEVDNKIRSSAQALYQVMVVGIGAAIGSVASGWIIENFYTTNGVIDWHGVMMLFAGYSLIILILFLVFFKKSYKTATITKLTH